MCPGVLVALYGWWEDLCKKVSNFFGFHKLSGIKGIASPVIQARNDRLVREDILKVLVCWCRNFSSVLQNHDSP